MRYGCAPYLVLSHMDIISAPLIKVYDDFPEAQVMVMPSVVAPVLGIDKRILVKGEAEL
jgi:hypothetical protein